MVHDSDNLLIPSAIPNKSKSLILIPAKMLDSKCHFSDFKEIFISLVLVLDKNGIVPELILGSELGDWVIES